MPVYRRGKTWWIDYRCRGERIREKVGEAGVIKKDDAEQILFERKRAVALGQNPTLHRTKIVTFKKHAEECLASHYAHKRSREWATIVIEKHLAPYFGERTLGEIDAKMIAAYVAERTAAGASPATVNGERAVLSKILNIAVDWDRLYRNPVEKIKKLEVINARERWLTHDEADKLIEKATDHLRPVIIAALETGGRLSEVLGLKWEDVNLDAGILYFSQTNTKNAKQREIPLTPALTATLRELRRVRRIQDGEDARRYVFTRYGKPLRDVRTAFTLARTRASLGADVTFHVLRHTFASWYLQRGGNLNLLRELLGHQDLKMTMRYAHHSPEYRRTALPLMGRQSAGAGGARGHKLVTTGQSSEAKTAVTA